MKRHHIHQYYGFTLVEVLVVVALLSFVVASIYNTLLAGQSVWIRTTGRGELQDNIRQAFDRILPELEQSGHDRQGVFQVSIDDNTGPNQSDKLRFSIPVVCDKNNNPVAADGSTAHWGAPLTWGCSKPSCMDANGSCDSVEYKYIDYEINRNNMLMRRILDYSSNLVREDLVAQNITNIQIEPDTVQKMMTITITTQKITGPKSMIQESAQAKVYLRNAR